jgi:hypothetical protein
MFRPIIYPFVLARLVCERSLQFASDRMNEAVDGTFHNVIKETIADAGEINELRAEMFALRSELNEIKYGGKVESVNAF